MKTWKLKQPTNQIEQLKQKLQQLEQLTINATEDLKVAKEIFNNQNTLNSLISYQKGVIAVSHYDVAKDVTGSFNKLELLEVQGLSYLAVAVAVEVRLRKKECLFTEEQRNDISMQLIKNVDIFDPKKIYPIARILLLSRLTQLENKDLLNELLDTLPKEIKQKIKKAIEHAYKLPLICETDKGSSDRRLHVWLPSIANISVGDPDYLCQFRYIMEFATCQTYADSAIRSEEKIQAEALAIALMEDPRFERGIESSYGIPYAQLTSNDRYNLCIVHETVARHCYNKQRNFFDAFTREQETNLVLTYPKLFQPIEEDDYVVVEEENMAHSESTANIVLAPLAKVQRTLVFSDAVLPHSSSSSSEKTEKEQVKEKSQPEETGEKTDFKQYKFQSQSMCCIM